MSRQGATPCQGKDGVRQAQRPENALRIPGTRPRLFPITLIMSGQGNPGPGGPPQPQHPIADEHAIKIDAAASCVSVNLAI